MRSTVESIVFKPPVLIWLMTSFIFICQRATLQFYNLVPQTLEAGLCQLPLLRATMRQLRNITKSISEQGKSQRNRILQLQSGTYTCTLVKTIIASSSIYFSWPLKNTKKVAFLIALNMVLCCENVWWILSSYGNKVKQARNKVILKAFLL